MSAARYMLDTNIVSALIRENSGSVAQRIASVGTGAIATSAIVVSELRYGYRKRGSDRLTGLVENAISRLEVLPYDADASDAYADIRHVLERNGKTIGPNDLLIAAHARSLDMTLVTDNIREFSRIEGLKLENWIERTEPDA